MSRHYRPEDDYWASSSGRRRDAPPTRHDRHPYKDRHSVPKWSEPRYPPSRRRVAPPPPPDFLRRTSSADDRRRRARSARPPSFSDDRRSASPPPSRRVRVPPPPPPLSEFTRKSSDPNCFEKVAESGAVDALDAKGDVEEGEVTEDTEDTPHGFYRDNFCAPVTCRMDPESLINFSAALPPLPSPQDPPRPRNPPPDALSASKLDSPPTKEKVQDEKPGEEEEPEEGEANQEDITLAYIQQKGEHQLLDKQFILHLKDINPVSALHELTQKLGWTLPNMKVAFECGPPAMKMYIYKAVVNGQEYQPAVAVDNKKDAKANAAWFALQEMGFVKPDVSNPL